MPQFQVTMRRFAMFLSLAEQHRRVWLAFDWTGGEGARPV